MYGGFGFPPKVVQCCNWRILVRKLYKLMDAVAIWNDKGESIMVLIAKYKTWITHRTYRLLACYLYKFGFSNFTYSFWDTVLPRFISMVSEQKACLMIAIKRCRWWCLHSSVRLELIVASAKWVQCERENRRAQRIAVVSIARYGIWILHWKYGISICDLYKLGFSNFNR